MLTTIMKRIASLALLTFLFSSNPLVGQEQDSSDAQWRLRFVQNCEIQKELEIFPDQLKEIETLHIDTAAVSQKIFSQLRYRFEYLSPEERSEVTQQVRSKIVEGMKAVEEKLELILVPHQIIRLDQIILQEIIRREGTFKALNSKLLKEELGLTSEDLKELAKKEVEIRRKLEEDIQKLRVNAEEDIVLALPPEKRSSFKALVGDKFVLKQSSWRSSVENETQANENSASNDRQQP